MNRFSYYNTSFHQARRTCLQQQVSRLHHHQNVALKRKYIHTKSSFKTTLSCSPLLTQIYDNNNNSNMMKTTFPRTPNKRFLSSNMNIRPDNPAFFTGNPNFYTVYKLANDFCRKLGLPLSINSPSNEQQFDYSSLKEKWISASDLATFHNIHVSLKDYQTLIFRFETLFPFHNQDPMIKSFLSKFLKPGIGFEKIEKEQVSLDEFGRSYTMATRKDGRAQVWMIPGDGQVFVNGQPLAYYFQEKRDRLNAIRPLVMADCLEKYNVWALVEKSGTSGQAEAIGIAVARGLCHHEIELKELLAPLAKSDVRHHERKKTNQPGARAKYKWTKR